MRAVAAVLAIAVAAGMLAGNAAAHPTLVATTPPPDARLPEAPGRIVLRFSEPVEPVGSGLTVTGPDGRDAAAGPARHTGATLTRALRATARGTYVVEWLVVGDDTHPARGAFLFSVGAPTRASLPAVARGGVVLVALGRWLSFLGFALGFGVVFAALLSGGMTRRLWRFVSIGIVLMIAAEPVLLLGQTATLAPGRMLDPAFARDILLTRYGHFAALRLGAAIGLWALVGLLRTSSSRAQWAIPGAGVAVTLAYAESAHGIESLPSPVTQAMVAVHVAAFAAWLGCVLVAVTESRRVVVARPAVLSAIALVASGAGLALAHIGRVPELVESAYGQTLTVKLVLVAVTFSLGAAARHRAELAGAFAVLAAAALLVSLVPPQ